MIQILKESFGTPEDASSAGHQSFEKEKNRKAQKSCAWAVEFKLSKKSKDNLSLIAR